MENLVYSPSTLAMSPWMGSASVEVKSCAESLRIHQKRQTDTYYN